MPERNWNGFRDERAAEVLEEWWSHLQTERGDRAELRRCRELGEVYFTLAYHHLYRQLAPLGIQDQEAIAVIAALGAHLKEKPKGGSTKFAARLATPAQPGGKAPLSDLRFRRLLQCKDREELFTALIRTLHLMGDAAPLADLAQGVYRWSWRGQPTQKEWAFDYYGALQG